MDPWRYGSVYEAEKRAGVYDDDEPVADDWFDRVEDAEDWGWE